MAPVGSSINSIFESLRIQKPNDTTDDERHSSQLPVSYLGESHQTRLPQLISFSLKKFNIRVATIEPKTIRKAITE